MTERMPFDAMLSDISEVLSRPLTLLELLLIAVCLGLAALAARYVRGHSGDGAELGRAARLGRSSVRRITFPLVGVLLIMAARGVLHLLGYKTHVLVLVAQLLVAMGLIRMAVFALRQVFAPSGWLASFERAFAGVVWLLFALHLLGILPELVEWMESIQFSAGKQKLSLWLILQGLVTVLVTLLVALWISGVIEARLMSAKGLDPSLKAVFTRLTKAVLVILGVMIALPMVGIDLTTLSVFSGALGVGLGFGLQKIASNYVSGFIILLDRSIQLGNVINVDRYRGEVMQINTRYTVLRSMTGVEAIVPNELLVSSVVENETLTNSRIRIALPVQVSYGADLECAMRVMAEAAAGLPRVLSDPAPQAYLQAFADSGINLELGVWIMDPQEGTQGVRSQINLRIWQAFKEAGIEIPYPQREVRVLQDRLPSPVEGGAVSVEQGTA